MKITKEEVQKQFQKEKLRVHVKEIFSESETESVFLLTGSDVSKIEHYENVQIIDTNRAVVKIQV